MAARIIQKAYLQSHMHERHSAVKTIQRFMKSFVRDIQERIGRILRFKLDLAAKKIQAGFRACNRTAFALRKTLKLTTTKYIPGRSVRCPITKVDIADPVFNVCDGKLYEKQALATWMLRSDVCPTTRRQPLEYVPLDSISSRLLQQREQIAQLLQALKDERLQKEQERAEHQRVMQSRKEKVRTLLPNFYSTDDGTWFCKHCNYKCNSFRLHPVHACFQHFMAKHA